MRDDSTSGVADEILRRCERCRFPLGPLLDLEDVHQEMSRFVEELGPSGAGALAACVVELSPGPSHLLDALLDLAEVYLPRFPRAFAEALLAYLDAEGPPVVVELLGGCATPGISETLIRSLDLEGAPPELQIAFLGALHEQADEAACRFVLDVDVSRFSGAAREELELVRRNMRKKPRSCP